MYNRKTALLEVSEAYPDCTSDKSSYKVKTSVERCCNGTFGKTKGLEKKLPQSRSDHP